MKVGNGLIAPIRRETERFLNVDDQQGGVGDIEPHACS